MQVVLGFDAKAIASAFLVSPSAMGKRLVRAKNKIRLAGIPFRIPDREELPARLGAVLDSVYAAYSAGWSDPVSGDLTGEAVFLATLISSMLPDEPEALGLVSLILYAQARGAARRGTAGEYIPFDMQDPELWDRSMIAHAEAALRQAHSRGVIGRFQLEAAIQSAHVHRRRTGESNWQAVVDLYDALSMLIDSPVIAINRALAIAELRGVEAGLKEMGALAGDARLNGYQPWWAARADLLSRAGAFDEAREGYEIAIGLEGDFAVRRFLQKRQADLPA